MIGDAILARCTLGSSAVPNDASGEAEAEGICEEEIDLSADAGGAVVGATSGSADAGGGAECDPDVATPSSSTIEFREIFKIESSFFFWKFFHTCYRPHLWRRYSSHRNKENIYHLQVRA